jgi:uncharacterized protein
MSRVIHFEIHADQPERAIAFYRELFGWEFKSWAGGPEYWVVTTGPEGQPGINGGLIRRRGPNVGETVMAYICTVDVPVLDDGIAKITSLGGQIVVPRMPIPGVGWLAYGKDPEGNIFGIMQNDPAAK